MFLNSRNSIAHDAPHLQRCGESGRNGAEFACDGQQAFLNVPHAFNRLLEASAPY